MDIMNRLFRGKRVTALAASSASAFRKSSTTVFSLLPFPWKKRIGKLFFTKRARKKLYDKLAQLIAHQVPLSSAISSISRRKTESNPGSAQAFVLQQITEGLQRKGNLTDAIKDYVPVMDTILISSGEASSTLDHCLQVATTMIVRGGKIQKAILKAISFPLFMSLLLLGLIWMLGSQFFPAFEASLPLEAWPQSALVVYGIGQFLDGYWYIILTVLTSFVLFLRWTMPNYVGRFRTRLDNIPPWSLYRIMQGASWLMAYSALSSAGRQGKTALQDILTQSGKNKWLYQRTLAILNGVSSNKKSIALAMNTPYNFPDKELVLDLQDYAMLSNINEIIGKIGFEWVDQAVELVEIQSAILNRVFFFLTALSVYMTVQSFFGIITAINQFTSQGGVF